ncbi:hypothetical protein SporoP37_02410 [Sporosarcina sp. P37]|uniref:hypothetical protein n=1 Tax=unclassified Sporosarcina TaxID=2647733 RepID=UPI000A179D46|nr:MULTISPECIES: hypothetical protein [unclassified Sporosarcina]ARK23654.1 hypothetical protein SporoP37_02410 [Sporosarcina sp. P37]PID18721.1 hypothetical protein CSV62_06340 [Sporosarcina sp. P35]
MKQRLKNLISKLFNRGEITEAVPAKKMNINIQKMNDLRAELSAIESGFNRTIADKEREYDTASIAYHEAYDGYSELFQRYKLGLVKEAKIIAEKANLKPLEDAVSEIGYELDTIRGYKRDESLSLLNQMHDLQDEYLKAKADEMNAVASEMKRMKLVYNQKLSAYGAGCSEVFDIERDMMHQLQLHGLNNRLAIGDKFTAMMQNVPEQFN